MGMGWHWTAIDFHFVAKQITYKFEPVVLPQRVFLFIPFRTKHSLPIVVGHIFHTKQKRAMPKRNANARWEQGLKDGKGKMSFGSGAFEGAYSFSSRFEEGTGTNPEELIAAAHAGCFSMALSGALEKEGFRPKSVETKATAILEKQDAGFTITTMELNTVAEVPGIEDAKFQEIADGAKANCPVSRALKGVNIKLDATLNK